MGSKELKHYTIRGRDIVKCRGMSFVDWCKLNGFEYMIDEVDVQYLTENYDLTLESMTQGFDKKIRWVCHKNPSHIMWFKPVHRTNGHWDCTVCSGRYLDLSERSVKVELAHLLDEWAYDRNDISPEQVSTGVVTKYWWRCRNCKEYFEQSPHKRRVGQGCPYCKNLKIKTGLNDVFTKRPDLEEEWDWERNKHLDPYNIPAGSDLKVGWVCRNRHRWDATITARANMYNSCPLCTNSVSFPERALAYYLSQFFTDVTRRHKIDGFEYDIYMPDENIAIEFNGWYWHLGREDIDNYKIELAKRKGIHFIRIDTLRDVPYNYISIKTSNDCFLHIECYCEKTQLDSVDGVVKFVCDYVLSFYLTDSSRFLSRIDCRSDFDKISIF